MRSIPKILALAFLSIQPAHAETVLYGADVSLGDLHAIDKQTGQFSDSLTLPYYDVESGSTLYGATGHPVNGLIYVNVSDRDSRPILATVDPTDGTVNAIGNMGSWKSPGQVPSLTFGPGPEYNIYLITGGAGGVNPPASIYLVDPATGEATFTGWNGSGVGAHALEYNPSDGFLYHFYNTDDSGDGLQQLEKIDMTTGVKTPVPLTGTLYGRVNACAYLGGNFYVHDNGANTLHSVTPAGLVTLVGSTSDGFLNLSTIGSSLYTLDNNERIIEINTTTAADVSTVALDPVPNNARFQSIARDPTTGILYGIGPADFPHASETHQLFQLDPLTGKVSNEVPLPISNFNEITFDSSGVLYGCAASAQFPGPTELLKGAIATINLSTGAVTPTGWATSSSDGSIFGHCAAYNSDDGLIYQVFTQGGALNLRSIDPGSGSITEIGAISGVTGSSFASSMTYDPEQGHFYIGRTNSIITVTADAVGTLLGEKGANEPSYNLDGIALIPDLKIIGYSFGADATISFESVLNREYGLYSSTNLVDWDPVAGFDCISATPPTNSETGVPLPSPTRGFFRLGPPVGK